MFSRAFNQPNNYNPKPIQIDKDPDRCPVCSRSILAVETNASWIANGNAEAVFRCPHASCHRLFVSRWRADGEAGFYNGAVPVTPPVSALSELIAEVSPSFVKIYNEAEKAEAMHLEEITGVGYRKAFEFLIKDYLTHGMSDLDQQARVRKKFLGRCIQEDVKNENVRAVALRAAWLGNDETHYVRLWVGKDVTDLKSLIALTVNWIEMQLRTEKLLADMPPS